MRTRDIRSCIFLKYLKNTGSCNCKRKQNKDKGNQKQSKTKGTHKQTKSKHEGNKKKTNRQKHANTSRTKRKATKISRTYKQNEGHASKNNGTYQ